MKLNISKASPPNTKTINEKIFSSLIPVSLSCSFLTGAEKTGTLTVQEAAELVKKANESNGKQYELDLKWLTSIDRDVARELSYYKGQRIYLDGLTSISKDVANELTT